MINSMAWKRNVQLDIMYAWCLSGQFGRIVPSNLNFKPRVDGDLLPTDPEKALRFDEYSHITTMMGVVQDEWARSMGWFFKDLKPDSGRTASCQFSFHTWCKDQRELDKRKISIVLTVSAPFPICRVLVCLIVLELSWIQCHIRSKQRCTMTVASPILRNNYLHSGNKWVFFSLTFREELFWRHEERNFWAKCASCGRPKTVVATECCRCHHSRVFNLAAHRWSILQQS